jgi:hypothetical protein
MCGALSSSVQTFYLMWLCGVRTGHVLWLACVRRVGSAAPPLRLHPHNHP